MSTSPSFVGPEDVTREKVADAADRRFQHRIHLLTPEDRWRERSKKALESAGRTPPAHTYSGNIFLYCYHHFHLPIPIQKVGRFMLKLKATLQLPTDS
jgi:hypothetical protein